MNADVKPLDWVEDLLTWEAPEQKSENHPLQNYKRDKLAENEREILVCHDMMGGYLEQERDAGYLVPSDSNPFTFLNWWNIDIFCYFSHHFVTIPPAGYVNIAHDHGCLVMGTFICEWKPGIEKCNKIFESDASMEKCVTKLVEIAEYYHFDGWLINIENVLKPQQLPMMCNFLQQLTVMMRSRLGRSRVIWYDSVIENGSLLWQNQLNHLNKNFYECCDGIYLNYNWTDEMLLNSADFGILSRIYVGVDVFGRGCIGGWDCFKPLSCVALLHMSLALFAPGWVTEKFQHENPIEINLKFWRLLENYTVCRPITEPFSTNFSAGFTQKDDASWFCLNKMSLQPHYKGNNFKTLLTGGLLILTAGLHRIFICDFDKRHYSVKLSASGPVGIYFNEDELEVQEKCGEFAATTKVPIALQTISILTVKDNTVIRSIVIC